MSTKQQDNMLNSLSKKATLYLLLYLPLTSMWPAKQTPRIKASKRKAIPNDTPRTVVLWETTSLAIL